MDNLKLAIETLGCKLNQAESEALARRMQSMGYQVVGTDSNLDIYILNTCTVTHIADRKGRHLLRLARRRNPEAYIIAAGCYARQNNSGLKEIQEADLLIENLDEIPHKLIEIFPAGHGKQKPAIKRTRSSIKIQEGCNTPCRYCIVPRVRGRETSRPLDDVIDEIKQRCAEGCREVILTGTKVGTYLDGNSNLAVLLKNILAKTGIERVRLSSLQPQEISTGLLHLWQDSRLCPHFHLALQSGSDAVLKQMNRQYTTLQYREVVESIRRQIPDASITTDIIAGFPGETDDDFVQTLEFCRQAGFARIHVFPYSPRRNTPAAQMPGQVAAQLKKARVKQIISLAEDSARRFHEKYIGRTLPVLWENCVKGVRSGYTGNYIKVYTTGSADLTNIITSARMSGLQSDGMLGVIE